MHQLALLLLLHLFALHLSDIRCWAQESTPTTTTQTTATISTSLPSFNNDNTSNNPDNTIATTTATTMSANPDNSSPFQLSVPSTVYQCENAVITWSGGNTVPLYQVYYAEGSGETGDESTLRNEQWLGSVSGNNFTWPMDPRWNTTIGDMIRFRVADNNGRGQNATAWSKVVAGNVECYAPPVPFNPASSFIVSIPQTTEMTTTKTSVAAMSLPSTSAAANPPQNGSSDNTSITSSPGETPVPAPSPTGNSANDSPSVGDSGSDNSNAPIEGNTQPSVHQGSGNGPIETVVQDGTTFIFGGGAAPQVTGTANGDSGSNQSVSPEVSDDRAVTGSKDDSAHVNLPGRAVGAIVGSLLGAILLFIIFSVWLRKRRNARKFHPMQEVDEEGSRSSSPGKRGVMRSLLAPATLASHNPFKSRNPSPPPLPTIVVDSNGRSLSPPSPALMGRDSGTYSQFLTTPEAYTATGDTFSALNSPDPFRRSFGAHPVPTVL
ncbi:hypothetical protein CPB86DRAFT_870077 [Serendipita vermifera]|nr:hypothetical protein CPB86DRAFT_870077 [Serendipita vermifera]